MNGIPMGKLLEAKLEFDTEPVKTFEKSQSNDDIIVGMHKEDDLNQSMKHGKDEITVASEDIVVVNDNDLEQRNLVEEVILTQLLIEFY